MLDFNNAPDHQGTGTGSAIPPESIVPIAMTIRAPKAGKEGSQHQLFCKSSTGNEYLDVEFEVKGQFDGRKIWERFTLTGTNKKGKPNSDQSMATLRAIIESSRNINPKDPSPAASAARQLSDWADFNGMTFLARVKCVVEQNQRDGQWYVNNEIVKVITPDMAEYQHGEHITDKPIPAIPDHTQPTAGPAAGSWGTATAATSAPTAAPATTTTLTPGLDSRFNKTTTTAPAAPQQPAFGGVPNSATLPNWLKG